MSTEPDVDIRRALHDIAAAQPFEPDPTAIRRRTRRARRQTWAIRGGAGIGAAAVLAAAVVATTGASPARSTKLQIAGGTSRSPATTHPTGAPASGAGQLNQLSQVLLASQSRPAGDATLVVSTERYQGRTFTGYSVWADGTEDLYFGSTPAALESAVAHHRVEYGNEGMYPRGIAAAEQAAAGDVIAARGAMRDSALPPGTPPPTADAGQVASGGTGDMLADSWIWNGCYETLLAGGRQPRVEAGVLRILATLPDVTVTRTSTAGHPTLTLTAGASENPVGAGYQQMVIDPRTGTLLQDNSWAPGLPQDAQYTSYQVSRVALADIAAGQFPAAP